MVFSCDAGRLQPPGGDVVGHRAHGVGDLGAAAVVDAHREGQHVVARGEPLGELQLVDDGCPQLRPRPAHRTRTPHSLSWSRRRCSTSRLKPIRKRTSSGERFQFSVENA